MTYGILNYINKKDRLYKLLLKTDVNSDKYADLKATFKQYRETLLAYHNVVSHRGHNCISSALTILDSALTS